MPIVPIEENKVGLASAADARFRAPDYSGSGLEALGAGLAQLGEGGQQFASGIEERRRRAAEAIAAAMLDDRHQGNIDDAAAKKAYVAYRDGATSLLHGEDGLFNKQGAGAHAAFPGVVLALADTHDAAKASLDDIQRGVVAPAMNEQLRSDVARAADHVRQQGAIEQRLRSAELQKAAARDAKNHADDPELFDHHLATGEKAIRQQAKIDNVGDKLLNKQIADYRSGVHADTIATLAARDPVHAAGWYARYGGNLNQRDNLRVMTALGSALGVARGDQGADAAGVSDWTGRLPGEHGAGLQLASFAMPFAGDDRDHAAFGGGGDDADNENWTDESEVGVDEAPHDSAGRDASGAVDASAGESEGPVGDPPTPSPAINTHGPIERRSPLGRPFAMAIGREVEHGPNGFSYSDGRYDPTGVHRWRGGKAHFGDDMKGTIGDPVYAAAAGRVVMVSTYYSRVLDKKKRPVLDRNGRPVTKIDGWGHYIAIQTPDGYVQIYGHLKPSVLAKFKAGQAVGIGERLGEIGNSGNAERKGDHLHFEVRRSNGSATLAQGSRYRDSTVDPEAWLAGRLPNVPLTGLKDAPILQATAQRRGRRTK